uniref:Uncharacterized protein n=1 Tax=Lotharella globosa TaxID=91324 RepID=A0A7S4DSQ0_9EUKA|mmetsp:Transcript_17826/g.35990  ORF Transcript_17826/g.35990 Transcript_17826/m.35990 type:complete len:356 (+) Transcript_17826:69-1136(+)|eukprot:CAMPEP_0167781814 /NCGR_PEP_ID=MMETSP0111_2-20121227/6150_1 /TAXON_ID=91324 /ORGANISM="Lotharella globosa, Strain CCCM811" /LENGTH=355 /DNA_ID=CAMNT_0007672535 /DNA_START=90 /DNA_END=1157 /DNA_ORIENTATION=+
MAAFSALLLILLSTGTHGAGLHGNTVRGMQQIGSRGLHRAVRPLDVNRKTLKTTTRLKARNDDAMRRELEKITTPTATGEKSMKGKGKLNDFAEQMTTRMASRETTTTAMVSLLVLASLVHGAPAHAFDIFDDDWIRNFKVDVAGFEIDHRVLVEGVVGGQFIGFVGALVGGRAAKQRKDEVEKLAQQLKEVNIKLRNKARASRPKKKNIEAKDPMHERILGYLRMGKRTLKDQNGPAALSAFQKAMDAIVEAKRAGPYNNYQVERKAYRGLGAASILLGKYSDSLQYMTKVVELSKANGDTSGLGDAYGVIADIYTEMGDFARAGDYYDLYMKAIVADEDTDSSAVDESEAVVA